MMVCVTDVAALKLALPACDAVTDTVPGPVIVKVVPDNEAGPETL